MTHRYQLGRGDDVVQPPAVGGADIHVLDEPDDVTGVPKVLGETHDIAVVHAPLDDGVDLHLQAGSSSSVDPLEDRRHREPDVVHRLERALVDRIQRDGDAFQAGRCQSLRLARQQRAIGRERDLGGRLLGEHLQQVLDVATEQRLAACEPYLVDAEALECPGQQGDLLEGQQQIASEKLVVPIEYLSRHAVAAPEVAPVGDRYPEVLEPTPSSVNHLHAARIPALRAAGTSTHTHR